MIISGISKPAAASSATLAAAEPTVVIAPLPSSALMGMILLVGIAAFVRIPTGKRQYRRRVAA